MKVPLTTMQKAFSTFSTNKRGGIQLTAKAIETQDWTH